MQRSAGELVAPLSGLVGAPRGLVPVSALPPPRGTRLKAVPAFSKALISVGTACLFSGFARLPARTSRKAAAFFRLIRKQPLTLPFSSREVRHFSRDEGGCLVAC